MKANTIIISLALTGLLFTASCNDMEDSHRRRPSTTTTTTEETTVSNPLTRAPLSTTVETQTTRSN